MTATDDHSGNILEQLATEARACRVCEAFLPHGCRPVLRVSTTARLLIASQAPGTRVHASGIPWDDASGKRLRQWLGMKPEVFYDTARVAILPMGLCFPGTNPKGGDFPPRPECAPLWQPRIRGAMPNIGLTLLIGSYAQKWYLGEARMATMTETVANWRQYAPDFIPLPHPSWRNTGWIRRNPWFEDELVPYLRQRTAEFL